MSNEVIPNCKMCHRPLRWAPEGQISTTTKLMAEGNESGEGARHKTEWARGEVLRVSQWRATHKRGYEGMGDFCGMSCAASSGQSIMNAINAGTHSLCILTKGTGKSDAS